MQIIKIKKDQSLADIALQEYGHIEGIFSLLEDNPYLKGITDNLYEADTLRVRDQPINSRMRSFLSSYEIATMSGARGEGIGYWRIRTDFKIN